MLFELNCSFIYVIICFSCASLCALPLKKKLPLTVDLLFRIIMSGLIIDLEIVNDIVASVFVLAIVNLSFVLNLFYCL